MLDKKMIGTLKTIIKRCDRMEVILENILYDDFCINDDKIELASFNLLQIGEIVGKLDDDLCKKYNKVPWKEMRSMRNRIAHGYDSVNVDIVWQTSKNDCPVLKKYCIEILNNNI